MRECLGPVREKAGKPTFPLVEIHDWKENYWTSSMYKWIKARWESRFRTVWLIRHGGGRWETRRRTQGFQGRMQRGWKERWKYEHNGRLMKRTWFTQNIPLYLNLVFSIIQQKTAKNTYENSCACIVSLIRAAWMKFCVTWNSTPTSQNLASVVPETQPMTDIHSGYIILAASCRKVQNYLRINLGHLAAVSVEHATIDLGVVSLNRMLSVKITFKNL